MKNQSEQTIGLNKNYWLKLREEDLLESEVKWEWNFYLLMKTQEKQFSVFTIWMRTDKSQLVSYSCSTNLLHFSKQWPKVIFIWFIQEILISMSPLKLDNLKLHFLRKNNTNWMNFKDGWEAELNSMNSDWTLFNSELGSNSNNISFLVDNKVWLPKELHSLVIEDL